MIDDQLTFSDHIALKRPGPALSNFKKSRPIILE